MATKQIVIPNNLSDTFFDKGVNTVNKIEYKLSYTITSLKAAINQPTTVMITDAGKEGLFKYDGTDVSSVNNDVSIIVDASGKRWKRVTGIINSDLPLTGGSLTGGLNIAGNVGVNTTSPLFALHTVGTIKSDKLLIGSNSDNGSALQITGNTSVLGNLGMTGAFKFTNTLGNLGEFSRIAAYNTVGTTGEASSVVFLRDNIADGNYGAVTINTLGIERLRVGSNGYTGIGITSPTALLHVNGAIKYGLLGTDLETSFNNKLQSINTIVDLQNYTLSNTALFDGSTWVKVSGGLASNGGSYAGTIINVSASFYWSRRIDFHVSVKWFGCTGDGTTDDTISFQAAIDFVSAYNSNTTSKSKLFVPQGIYRITTTLNLTSAGLIFRHGTVIEFQIRSTQYQFGTLLVGDTGNLPVIETTGSDGITLINCGIIAGTVNPSKIGVLQARPDGGGWVGRQTFTNLYINLGSVLTANNNIGTIGFINIAGEECEYNNAEIWANLCFVSSSSKDFRTSLMSGGNLGFKDFSAVSAFGILLHTAGSNTVFTFSGINRFVSYDYFSPAVLIFNASDFNLNNTFIQKRLPNGVTASTGNYTYAIECWNCYGFTHTANVEGCGQYMLLRRDLTQAKIKVVIAPVTISTNPYLYCWNDGGVYAVTNSEISIYSPSSNSTTTPLIGFNNLSGAAAHTFRSSNVYDNRNYTSTLIDQNILNNTYNSNYNFYDKRIEYTKNVQLTYGSAIPTTGTYQVGDKVYNVAPNVGEYLGWTCTIAGTPGTFKGFGLVDVGTTLAAKANINNPVFTGRVGINTALPSSSLQINDYGQANGIILGNRPDVNLAVSSSIYSENTGNGVLTIQTVKAGSDFGATAIQPDGGKVGIGTRLPTSKLQVVGLSTYADNATAIAAGLTVGAFYRTATGVLMVAF